MLGCKAAGLDTKIIGIAIEPVENKEKYIESIKTLFHKTNALLHEYDSSFALFELDDEDIHSNFDFCGTGYGIFTPEGSHASAMIKETQGVILEGTYTAKAFAALLHDIEIEKPDGQTFLFWNTYCGLDFAQRLRSTDYKELPACFHSYFE
jgi:D-cysteine desulfhydrase